MKINYKEILCLLVIIIFSLLNIKKGYLLNKRYITFFNKQIIWITISLIIYFLIYKINFKKIYKLKYIIYIFNIFLLIYVLIFSKSINNTKAWINIFGLSFQPSELIKITYPIISINYFKHNKYLIPTILFLIPFTLILLEPDTGNAILLLLIFIYLLKNKNNKKIINIFIAISIMSIFIFILIFKYKSSLIINLFDGKLYYRFKRIMDFKNNYQINNALIGIGNAKLFPIPLNKLIIYIPEGLTDFMFSFHICNFGIVFSIFLILIYMVFTYQIIKKYLNERYIYHKKLIGAFLTVFISQEIYNILMNIGLMPIMGIPLPFFSYGGSNIITYFIFYSLVNKKISSIEDKDNNNYKNNYHKVQMGIHSNFHN